MKRLLRFALVSVFMFLGMSCSIHLKPQDFEMKEFSVPDLHNIQPVTIQSRIIGAKDRSLSLPGSTIATVNEDEFTEVLVKRLKSIIEGKNVSIESRAKKSIEIQVVRVSIQPDRTMFCVIDFNRKLGDGEFYGFQSRSKHWSFITSCDNALRQAAIDTLADQDTIRYLKGD